MHRLPLPYELYLLAHDETGKVLVHSSTLNVGLAGAALLDLLIGGRVQLHEGRVHIVDATPVGEAFTDRALEAILALRNAHTPQTWIGWLAERAHDWVGDALVNAGLLRRSTGRRFGMVPVTRQVPVDEGVVVQIHGRIRYAVLGIEQPDVPTGALCALVTALRLESGLYVNVPQRLVLVRLEAIGKANPLPVREVVAAVGDAAAAASTALHR